MIGTGHTCSVRDLCETAFTCVGLDYREFVKQDAEVLPARPRSTCSSPIRPTRERELAWEPTGRLSTSSIEMMVDADLARHARPE